VRDDTSTLIDFTGQATSMTTLDEILAVLDVQQTGEGRFSATSVAEGAGSVVFGGQLLGQSLMAAAKTVPDKQVLSMHTLFVRGASFDSLLDLRVDTLHTGRAFSSASIAIHQEGRLCATTTVLLHAPDEDLIRYQVDAPSVDPPDDLPSTGDSAWWDVRIAEGVDLRDPEAIGPPELRVWSRVPGAPDDEPTNQALLAYATDGFLIGTAMRPHPGIGQSLAHVTVSTTVLAHTLTFHDPVRVSDWLLLDQRSTVAGRGRSHGLGEVFAADGRLVCSFTQENMIRAMPAAHRASGSGTTKY
jgi:acyl-CoA thioesterase